MDAHFAWLNRAGTWVQDGPFLRTVTLTTDAQGQTVEKESFLAAFPDVAIGFTVCNRER